MSIKQRTMVWELRDLTPTHKLILLGLADWANDEGLCWPSIDRLAQKTGLSRRTIQTNIRQLEACRYMKREEVVGRGNRYWLTLEDDPLPSDFEPFEGRSKCTRAADAPVQEMRGGGAAAAPNTLKIHQKDIYKGDWPDWLPLDAWVGFVNMRNATKKPMTDRAVQNLLTKLEKMRAAGQDVAEVLDQSTNACWADVYEVKERRNGKQRKQVTGTATAAQRAIDHYEARNH